MEKIDFKRGDLNLKSEEMQELMGEIPPVIVRVGIALMTFFVVAALVLSMVIRYPEQVRLHGKLVERQDSAAVADDTCTVNYSCAVGLEDREKMQNARGVMASMGNYTFQGKVEELSSTFDRHTGMFSLQVKLCMPRNLLPIVLQYRDSTVFNIDVSSESIFQKVFLSKNLSSI